MRSHNCFEFDGCVVQSPRSLVLQGPNLESVWGKVPNSTLSNAAVQYFRNLCRAVHVVTGVPSSARYLRVLRFLFSPLTAFWIIIFPAQALSFVGAPAFTPSIQAPLAGSLDLTTDVESRVGVTIDDGVSVRTRYFPTYATNHSIPDRRPDTAAICHRSASVELPADHAACL